MGDIHTCIDDSNDRTRLVNNGFVPQFFNTVCIEIPLLVDHWIATVICSNVVVGHDIDLIIWLSILNFVKFLELLNHLKGLVSFIFRQHDTIELRQVALHNHVAIESFGTTR